MANDDAPIRTGLEPEARVTARRLLERTGAHPVVSVYFDLARDEFATPRPRLTEVHSLVDTARRGDRTEESALSHEEKMTLRADLERIDAYLQSDDVPVSGAGTVAIFCSGQDDLFETVKLATPVTPHVVIGRTPYIEPLVVGHDPGRWCVALVNERSAHIFEGYPVYLSDREDFADDVRQHPRSGGLSQANLQRSFEADVDSHLRRVNDDLLRRWERDRYSTLVLGGPVDPLTRLEGMLHGDLRERLSSSKLDLDVDTVNESEVREAAKGLLVQMQTETQRAELQELSDRLGMGARGAAGLEATLEALAERRVQTLLVSHGFQAAGGRCPQDGLLTTSADGSCPADGTPLEPVDDLREAAVQAAILQDAEVIVLDDPPPGPAPQGEIAALLRF